jgi:hypothetical protein
MRHKSIELSLTNLLRNVGELSVKLSIDWYRSHNNVVDDENTAPVTDAKQKHKRLIKIQVGCLISPSQPLDGQSDVESANASRP